MFWYHGTIPQGAITRKVYKPTATPGSAPTYRNEENLKMLQYIQLKTINYSDMILILKYVM